MGFVREPAVSGMFYPGNAGVLRKDIEQYLEKVEFDRINRVILSIVTPHAGYMYSGPVAAYVLRR